MGGNGRVSYKLQKSNDNSTDTEDSDTSIVEVDQKTGDVTLLISLEPGNKIIFIEAYDLPSNPSEKRTSLAVVTIKYVCFYTNLLLCL